MNNAASLLVLILFAITFTMSSHEKIFHWKDTMTWLKNYFGNTFLKNYVPLVTGILLVFELISAILCLIGCVELYTNNLRTFGLYGAIFSCICLLLMLFGQRLAKDYDGARNIVIYFIPAVLAVFWLS